MTILIRLSTAALALMTFVAFGQSPTNSNTPDTYNTRSDAGRKTPPSTGGNMGSGTSPMRGTMGTDPTPGTSATSDADRAISGANPASNAAFSSADEQLLRKLHHANQMEISMGKMGQEKASSSQVRTFSAQMVQDHKKADDKLMLLTAPTSFKMKGSAKETKDKDTDHKAAEHSMSFLKTQKGAEFDKAFIRNMIDDHQKVIDALTTGRAATSDSRIIQFIDETLPVIRKHKESATELGQQLGAVGLRTH